MKRFLLGLATVATGCAADTNDLGRTVTDYGFGSPRWTIAFGYAGGTGRGLDETTAIVIDPHGDVINIGSIWDQVDFGGAPVPYKPADSAAYITKRSGADGSDLWTVSAGTGPYENVQLDAVATDSAGNIIVAGVYHDASGASFGGISLPDSDGMAFVAKLDPAGNTLWAQALSPQTDPDDESFAGTWMALADDGRIFVAAQFAGTIVFPNATFTESGDSAVSSGVIVSALDPDGTVLWGRAFQGPGEQMPYGLTAMPNGDVVVAGSLTLGGSFEGPLLLRPVNASQTCEWLARLDRDGNLAWQRVLSLPGDLSLGGPVTSKPDGTIAVSFSTQVASETPIIPNTALLDASGNTLWTSAAPDHPIPGGASVGSLASAGDSLLIIAGQTQAGEVDLGNGATLTNSFLAAYDPTGASGTLPAQLSLCPPSADDCYVQSIGASSGNGLAIAFDISGHTDFANGPSVQDGEIAIMMLDQ